MSIVLVSLVLNEEEFLLKNYAQHTAWPGLTHWVFVEGADPAYAKANPRLVTRGGLSIDETSSTLLSLAKADPRVRYIPYGWFDAKLGEDQAKCDGRNQYLRELDRVLPKKRDDTAMMVVDADEFYTREDQHKISTMAPALFQNTSHNAFIIQQRHLWRPKKKPDTNKLEVVGGYWAIPHARLFRWHWDLWYGGNHNIPMGIGTPHPKAVPGVQCVHLGFAKQQHRAATHRYYEERGEGKEKGFNRQMYVDCRRAWEDWKEGDTLPHGARVIPFEGRLPECFV